MKNIIVASTSGLKIASTQQAFFKVGIPALIKGSKVTLPDEAQTVGSPAALKAAYKRAFSASDTEPDADMWIGIQSYVDHAIIREGLYLTIDFAMLVVHTKQKTFVGTSAGMIFPQEKVFRALQYGFETTTIGSIVAGRGDPSDPHSIMSNGTMSRKDFIAEGLAPLLRQAFA
jgi:non-canonical (house-cleaning) NTP pyrophosphatase